MLQQLLDVTFTGLVLPIDATFFLFPLAPFLHFDHAGPLSAIAIHTGRTHWPTPARWPGNLLLSALPFFLLPPGQL